MQQPPRSPQPQPSQPQQPMQSGPLGEQWQTPPQAQQPYPPQQYPPQQYPPQQYPPQQYPPQPLPPRKKRRGRTFLVVGVVVIVLIIIIVVIVNSGQSPKNTGNTSSPSSSTATSVPAQTGSQTFKVGQVVTVGNTWQITVLSAKTSAGGQFSTLQKPSDVYLLVAVSMKNISGQEQDVSSLIQWTLKDSTGQTYNETIDTDAPATPDGKVAASSLLKGTIAYEVPKSMKSFTLSFQNDITSTGQTIWTITV